MTENYFNLPAFSLIWESLEGLLGVPTTNMLLISGPSSNHSKVTGEKKKNPDGWQKFLNLKITTEKNPCNITC